MTSFDPRVLAAARVIFNTSHGYDPADTEAWDSLSTNAQRPYVDRAAVMVSALDAADDRVRLTMDQFLAIKAQTVSDLSIDLHSRHGSDPGAQAVLASVAGARAALGDRFLDPVDVETAMDSLIQERLAIALRATADSFDRACLQDVTGGFDFDHGMAPRTLRKVISGCADWLRNHADELDDAPRRPYRRVDKKAIIDEDRLTAVLGVIGRLVRRSKALADQDRHKNPFIMTDMLVEALEGVGATIETAE